MSRKCAAVACLLLLGPLPLSLGAGQQPGLDAAPSEGGLTRVAVAADAQETGERPQFRAAIDLFEQANASLLFFAGDTSYGYADAPPDWVDALGPYAEEGRTLLVLGSHDDAKEGHLRFVPGNQTWWTQEIGGVVVVALDSSWRLQPETEQEAWLMERLEAHEDRFVVLTLHIPWWVEPPEDRRPTESFQHDPQFFDAFVVEHDVDLVLAAHEHYYSRMERLNTTFVIAGPVEARLRPVPEEVQNASEMALSQHLSMLMDFSPCGIRSVVLDEAGAPVDSFDVPLLSEGNRTAVAVDQDWECAAGDPTPRLKVEENSNSTAEDAANATSQNGNATSPTPSTDASNPPEGPGLEESRTTPMPGPSLLLAVFGLAAIGAAKLSQRPRR